MNQKLKIHKIDNIREIAGKNHKLYMIYISNITKNLGIIFESSILKIKFKLFVV